MRLKNNIFGFIFFLTILQLTNTVVVACCEGKCNTHETCSYTNTFSQTYDVLSCGAGNTVEITCYKNTDNVTEHYDPDNPYAEWIPWGHETTVCTKDCKTGTDTSTGLSGSITEEKDFWCGPCDEPTPSPTPQGGDGGGGGGSSETTSYIISGNIQNDLDAGLNGEYCSQTVNSPLLISGQNLIAENLVNSYNATFSNNQFTINTLSSGNNFTVILDLSHQTGDTNYVCSCPAPTDPSNPYVCQYTGVVSPNTNINFYLREYNLSNDSWFQIFGGNYFSRYQITNSVPYNFCFAEDNCQPAFSVPIVGSDNQNSSGFPIINSANSDDVMSSAINNYKHSYFNLSTKTNNINSYAVDTNLNQLSYDYFLKLTQNSIQEIGNGEDLEPLLSDWTNAAWWIADDINYIKVNGNVNIDETQGFSLSGNQKLIVFVDGNLILDDSDTNDSNRKITDVAQGSFLAFFVSGDIIITADVGYELDPLNPSTPIVSNANSNVEGIFVANNDLIIQSKTAIGEVPPDRKFIGAGTFVGWNNVLLNRTFNDDNFGPILNNTQAVENFVYRPDLLANWPVKLKASTSNWREVDPQFIGQ